MENPFSISPPVSALPASKRIIQLCEGRGCGLAPSALTGHADDHCKRVVVAFYVSGQEGDNPLACLDASGERVRVGKEKGHVNKLSDS